MNNNYEPSYKALLERVLYRGTLQPVRDNNEAWSKFGESLTFDAKLGLFPMLTSKAMYFKNVKFELSWILKGLTNIKYLKGNDVNIWDSWADEHGEIGDTYGRQLRSFNGIDQMRNILIELKNFKYSRQMVISLWNPVAISQGNLKPCYHSFQFVVIGNRLNIQVSQRSADLFVGLPYDMATFTLLQRLVADKMGLGYGEVKINIGNAHIYKEHLEGVKKYIDRPMYDICRLVNTQNNVINFNVSKVELRRYKHESFIKAKIIV